MKTQIEKASVQTTSIVLLITIDVTCIVRQNTVKHLHEDHKYHEIYFAW